MKVKVRVITTMEYESIVEADTESEAVRQAKLDALLVDGYDYKGQFAEYEVLDESAIVGPDPAKLQKLQLIKSEVERRNKIRAILEEECD